MLLCCFFCVTCFCSFHTARRAYDLRLAGYHQVRILHDNVLNIDFSEATCIFIYLVPEGMKLLQPLLVDALRRGVRIVTYGKLKLIIGCSILLIVILHRHINVAHS